MIPSSSEFDQDDFPVFLRPIFAQRIVVQEIVAQGNGE